VFRGNAIVNDATGDVFIEHADPFPDIWSKVERFKAFWMKSHSIESKDFSKSKKTAIPGIFFILVNSSETTLYVVGLTTMYYTWQDLF